MSEFVIITGLSGAGRSQAADTLEDLGWFVIDNLPPALIAKVAELVQIPGSATERVALVVGTGHYLDELTPALDQLRASAGRVRVLFLEASDDVLVRRYENTRRRHPLAESDRVTEGIERERALLDPVKSQADVVVDTSDLNVHQLRDRLLELFGNEAESPCRPAWCPSATSTACPSTSTWSSTAGSCPTRTGWTSCGPSPASTHPCATTSLGQPETPAFLGQARRPVRPSAAGLRQGGQVLPVHRRRLHRRHATGRSSSPRSWPSCSRSGVSDR